MLLFIMRESWRYFSSLKTYELKMSGNILDLIDLPFQDLILLQYVFLCVHISIDISYQMQFSLYFSPVLYGPAFYNPTA